MTWYGWLLLVVVSAMFGFVRGLSRASRKSYYEEDEDKYDY